MSIINNMAELREKSILVYDGMETYFPQFSKREKLVINKLNKEPKTYSYNNSVIAFVDEHGLFYAIPAFKGIQTILIKDGYRRTYFYVPFSNWDYPVQHEKEWESLWDEKNAEQ